MTASAGRTHLAMSTVQDPAYERFDTIGLNYRMNEISAAVGLDNWKDPDEIVGRRKEVAKLFAEAVADAIGFRPQRSQAESTTSTIRSLLIIMAANSTASLKDFNRYVERGGDGFYGACMILILFALKGNTSGTRFAVRLVPLRRHFTSGQCSSRPIRRNMVLKRSDLLAI